MNPAFELQVCSMVWADFLTTLLLDPIFDVVPAWNPWSRQPANAACFVAIEYLQDDSTLVTLSNPMHLPNIVEIARGRGLELQTNSVLGAVKTIIP